MKYILYTLFLVSFIFGNEELNNYLNNKNLQHQIIRDKKNERIIIDLLYDESKLIVFRQLKNGTYKKTFDESLYFCDYYRYSNKMIKKINNKLIIVCSMPNVDNLLYRGYYKFEDFISLNNKLLSIEKHYININNDKVEAKYIFTPKINIPTLNDFTVKKFSDTYLDKNYENFIKVDNKYKSIQSQKQPLYKTPPIKTKMYLIKGDKVEILEKKDDWLHILYKGKKDIKAWIPKSAVE